LKMTIYSADCCHSLSNCIYPNKHIVTDKATLVEAVKNDHVTAEYKDNYRSNTNFIKADNIPLDCDNDHSDNPKDWVTPSDVADTFPGVSFVAVYSRNHMKDKNGKSARPRFHIYFPIPDIIVPMEYAMLKKRIATAFPYFDDNALDSARLLFGTPNPQVELFEGKFSIVDLLEGNDFATWDNKTRKEVPEGRRNSTMSNYAGKIIKRYGATEQAHQLFLQRAEDCVPPLDDEELNTIWNSAVKFGTKVALQDGYIPPEQYNAELTLKPNDYSDIGQAVVMAREYNESLLYSPATGYLKYNGSFWEESETLAQAIAQELTTRQLEEADAEIQKRLKELQSNGAFDILSENGSKKAEAIFTDAQAHAFELYQNAVAYKKYVIKRRDSKYITSALKEVRPMVSVDPEQLDKNENLLNTPDGTYDLSNDTLELQPHKAQDLLTKQTAVSANNKGMDIWLDAVNTFFCNDESLIEYVQQIVGLALIGKVYEEALIIAYGEGRNGKSTFWNAIARVLGTYSGNMSADVLTVGCKRNVKPELAEAKGKRLLIAAELEEGMRLNTSTVKNLCSTDRIYAEKKYKAPFSFDPTHTVVLYTNHLPKVGAIDEGTWRRLIILPFDAKIEGSSDIKNFSEYLFEKAGGAILTWAIEGAKKVKANNNKPHPPKKVQDAIRKYRESNDWMMHFLTDCCEIDKTYMEKSGELYSAYRAYCLQVGEFTRSTAEFYTALECYGYDRKKTNTGNIVMGLKLKSEFLE